MKLVFIFAIVFIQMFLIDLLKVMEIVGTFGIDALVKDKVFPVLFVDKGITAVGTAQGIVFVKPVVIGREIGIADLAF